MQNQIYTYSWDGNQPQHFQIGKTVNSKQQKPP